MSEKEPDILAWVEGGATTRDRLHPRLFLHRKAVYRHVVPTILGTIVIIGPGANSDAGTTLVVQSLFRHGEARRRQRRRFSSTSVATCMVTDRI